MMSRHFRKIAILIAIFALLLAACGPQETETPEPTEEAVTEEVEETEEAVEEVEETEEATEDEATEEADAEAAEATEEAMDDMEATEEAMDDMEATEEAMDDMEATEEAVAEETEAAMDDMEATEEAMDDMEETTIVDLAMATEDLSILVDAVVAAELAETLSSEGPFTVFAPTNAAFEAAIEALGTTAEDLLADTELLTSVLTYHVVDGEVFSMDLEDGMEVATLNGETLIIGVSDDGVTVTDVAGNTVNVTTADVDASNGVVHIIDGVLLPIPAEGDMEATEEAMAEETEEAMGDMEATEEAMAEETEEAMGDMEATEEAMGDMDDMGDMETVAYDDGAGFEFAYPAGYELTEGDGSYTLAMGDQRLIVVAPATLDRVVPAHDASPEERLTSYVERIGYDAGEPADMMMAAASINISLERRGQVGFANLVDLGGDRFGVVLELGPDADNVPSADGAVISESMVFTPSIVGTAQDTEDLSILVDAVVAAGLDSTLDTGGPFTVFAPSNAAFEAALEALGLTAEELLADTELLTSVLTYHVVEGEAFAALPEMDMMEEDMASEEGAEMAMPFAIEDGMELTTLNGATLIIGVSEDGVTVTDSTGTSYNVVTADVVASNGVVHIIDGVLLPPMPEPEAEMTEEAMDDMEATEEAEAEATEEANAEDDMDMMDEPLTILGLALQTEGLETLATALVRGGFSSTFNGEGSFTVFAPTDDAFAAALEALGLTADELLADQDLLSSVLTYHVVDGEVFSTDLVDGMEVETLNGATLIIGVSDEGVTVTDGTGAVYNVTMADVDASNGVVHVIDGVLLPPSGE